MKKSITLSILFIFLVGMACTFSAPPDNEAVQPEQLGTSAAATLTALAEQPDLIGTSVAATLAAQGGEGENTNDADLIATSVVATLAAAADNEAPQDAPPADPLPQQIVYIVNGGDIWLWAEGIGATELLLDQPAYAVKLSDGTSCSPFLVP